ncbi:MAG: ATP-binding protein [Candidatus Eisenbacteria bacterium]
MVITSEQDVIKAREAARTMAAEMGFPLAERAMIAGALSELARNILDYAGNGEILLSQSSSNGDRPGITLIARDSGPGIPNVAFVLQAGYAVSSLGLRGVRVLMDQMEVISEIGKGTTVTARKWRT